MARQLHNVLLMIRNRYAQQSTWQNSLTVFYSAMQTIHVHTKASELPKLLHESAVLARVLLLDALTYLRGPLYWKSGTP